MSRYFSVGRVILLCYLCAPWGGGSNNREEGTAEDGTRTTMVGLRASKEASTLAAVSMAAKDGLQ